MKRFKRGLIFAAAAVFALAGAGYTAAQSRDMGGHDSSMTKEDPAPFIRDMEKAARDTVNQVKAGRVMDARGSVSRLTGAADKVAPHITDAALKEKLLGTVKGIKALTNAGSPDLFDLEDKEVELQDTLRQVLETLQGMRN